MMVCIQLENANTQKLELEMSKDTRTTGTCTETSSCNVELPSPPRSPISPLSVQNKVVAERLDVDDFGHAHVYQCGGSVLEEKVSDAETRIQKRDLPEFFDSLAQFETDRLNILRFPSAYALAATDTSLWNHMTCCVKNNLLTKITQHGWNKWSISTHHEYAQSTENAGKHKDWEHNNNLHHEVLRFIFPQGDPTSHFSKPSLNHKGDLVDTSSHVLSIIDEYCTYQDADEIIGEFQFCFIVGIKLGNEAYINHYRHILRIMFRAYGLILRSANLMAKFIEAFHAHLIYNEDLEVGIFDIQPYFKEELTHHLTLFKLRLSEVMSTQLHHITPLQKNVVQVFDCLESFFDEKSWDLGRVENCLGTESKEEEKEVSDGDSACSSWSFSIGDDRGISEEFDRLEDITIEFEDKKLTWKDWKGWKEKIGAVLERRKDAACVRGKLVSRVASLFCAK